MYCGSVDEIAHFTRAMQFPPVDGGCYIISSVGNGYSCGMSVMWCILSVRYSKL